MSRIEKKKLRKTKSIKLMYGLLLIVILLIIGVFLVDRTLGQMTGNNDLRAIGMDIEEHTAIVHFLGNKYQLDYMNFVIKLEEVVGLGMKNLVKIKEKISSLNVGK